MRVIIAGSRTINEESIVQDAIFYSHMDITEIVSGGAKGVDKIAIVLAKRHKIPLKVFIPEWKRYGKEAGPIRNQIMAQYAQGLIAVWDGQSKGTRDMINQATRCGLKVYVYEVK